MSLGEQVAAARKALGKGWTQERVTQELRARGLKMTRSWIAQVETDRLVPHPDDMRVLAAVLKKAVEQFVVPSPRSSASPDTTHYAALEKRLELLEEKIAALVRNLEVALHLKRLDAEKRPAVSFVAEPAPKLKPLKPRGR